MKARVILQGSEGIVDTQMIDIDTIQEFPAIIILRDLGETRAFYKTGSENKGKTGVYQECSTYVIV